MTDSADEDHVQFITSTADTEIDIDLVKRGFSSRVPLEAVSAGQRSGPGSVLSTRYAPIQTSKYIRLCSFFFCGVRF